MALPITGPGPFKVGSRKHLGVSGLRKHLYPSVVTPLPPKGTKRPVPQTQNTNPVKNEVELLEKLRKIYEGSFLRERILHFFSLNLFTFLLRKINVIIWLNTEEGGNFFMKKCHTFV